MESACAVKHIDTQNANSPKIQIYRNACIMYTMPTLKAHFVYSLNMQMPSLDFCGCNGWSHVWDSLHVSPYQVIYKLRYSYIYVCISRDRRDKRKSAGLSTFSLRHCTTYRTHLWEYHTCACR